MRKRVNANKSSDTKKTNEIAELRKLVADSIKSTEEYKKSTEEYKKNTEEYKKKVEEYTRRVEEYSRRIEQYIQNNQKDWVRFKRELGNISNRMGTLVEDFIIPSMPSICKTLTGSEPDMISARIERKKNGDFIQYDTISLVKNFVVINETKSSISSKDIDWFLEKVSRFRYFFPEYRDKKIIPVVSSLYIHPHVIKYATRKRVYAVGLKGEEMQVLNLFPVEKSLR